MNSPRQILPGLFLWGWLPENQGRGQETHDQGQVQDGRRIEAVDYPTG